MKEISLYIKLYKKAPNVFVRLSYNETKIKVNDPPYAQSQYTTKLFVRSKIHHFSMLLPITIAR